MKRILLLAALCGLAASTTGCGSGGANATPVKADDATVEAQKKQQAEADDGEKKWQKQQNKK